MTTDILTWLQCWYHAQTDGNWEHQCGISIATIDNPGWRVVIELHGTPLANKSFARIETETSESDWMQCWVDCGAFHSACGSHNLTEALTIFRKWADENAG
jgi:hypothetical protein